MIYLINFHITPGSGVYHFQQLSPEGFKKVMADSHEAQMLDNRIADPEFLDIIKEFTKVDIPLCPLAKARGNIEITTGDAYVTVGIARGEEEIRMRAVLATFYADDPEGMVACAIDAQQRLEPNLDRKKWYTQFRDQLNKNVELNPIRKAETINPDKTEVKHVKTETTDSRMA